MTDELKRAREHLHFVRGLMQSAKGIDGPCGGFVTDYLDAAENQLDYAAAALNTRPSHAATIAQCAAIARGKKKGGIPPFEDFRQGYNAACLQIAKAIEALTPEQNK